MHFSLTDPVQLFDDHHLWGQHGHHGNLTCNTRTVPPHAQNSNIFYIDIEIQKKHCKNEGENFQKQITKSLGSGALRFNSQLMQSQP